MNWLVFGAVWSMAITMHFFLVRSDDLAERLAVILPWLVASGAAGLVVPPEQTRMALEIFGLAVLAELPHRLYVRWRERRERERVQDDLATLRPGWGPAGPLPSAGESPAGEDAGAHGEAAGAAQAARVR
jgi:hypothetical protein